MGASPLGGLAGDAEQACGACRGLCCGCWWSGVVWSGLGCEGEVWGVKVVSVVGRVVVGSWCGLVAGEG